MRVAVLGVVALLALGLPALHAPMTRAEEEPAAEEPRDEKPAAEMTEEERADALSRAKKLSASVVRLHRAGRSNEGIAAAREALALRTQALGPDHPHVAASLSNLASLLHATGQYEEAHPLFERAVRIEEKTLGPDHPEVATSLNNLASLLRDMGQYDEARPLYERALRIDEKAHGPDHPHVAGSLHNLASLLKATGAYEEARRLQERALRIFEMVLGPDHLNVASGLHNLATLLQATGHYEEARPLLERALRIWERELGPDHPYVAGSLTRVASLLEDTGQYEEALPLLEEALRIREAALGPDHPHVAQSLNLLALLLRAAGQYEKARPLQERAVRIYEKAFGPDHPDVATTLATLASLLKAMGQHEEARPLYERALRIDEKAFGPDHPSVAVSLHNLASLLEVMGQYEKARPLLVRALRIDEEAHGPNHPHVAVSLHNLASLLEATGQYERAVPSRKRCLDIIEVNIRRNFTALLATQRVAMARSARGYVDTWLRLARRLGHPGYGEVLRFKGLVARATAADRRLARSGGERVVQGVLDLRAATRRLSKLANSMPAAFPKEGRLERRRAWQKAYAEAGAERERLALALARECAPVREGLERLDLTLADVQARLGPGSALVDLLRSGGRYLAWIVRSGGEAEAIDLGEAAPIQAAAEEFAGQAADRKSGEARLASSGALRKLVWAPIEERLPPGIHTLYVCPDAELAAVPLGALGGKSEDRILLDDYRIIFVSMAQDLVPWKDEPKAGEGAVLVGDVHYGKASEVEEDPVEASRRLLAAVDRAPRGRALTPLHATREEVRSIGALLGDGAIPLTEDEATEARLRTHAPGRRIVHFATHAVVRTDLMRGLGGRKRDTAWLGADAERQMARGHDPMLLAWLAMAGANPRDGGGGDDGILTALEASHLDLDGVEMVVLSACDTARGTAESGEGVIGLVQGFQMAGAKQVIGSLWKVDDEATRALMVRFYELWNPKDGTAGLGAAAALKKAQEYIRGHEKWKHPYYWAAWVLWGLPD